MCSMVDPADGPVTGWRRFASIEPLVFILLFSYSISDNVMTDMIIYKTCIVTPGLNKSECDILHKDSHSEEAMRIENIVQPRTSSVFMLQSIIQTIFPTILSLFLGPWSDKNGRKPLLIFPFMGQAIGYAITAALSRFNLNSYWYILPSIPASFFGGFPPIMMSCVCYLTDITTTENRSWRLAMMDTSMFVGLLVGLLLGPVVFKQYGYTAVFSLSSIGCFLAMLYSLLILKETVENNERTFSSIFDVSLVKELFTTLMKKREGFDRCLVWSCISVIVLHVVILEGNSSISYLFTSAKLGWGISDFSIYQGTHLVIAMIGMLFLIRFAGSVLNLPEIVVIVISCLSNTMGCFAKAFVKRPWHMYFSSSLGLFSASTVPVVRSIMSKSINQKDLGKVFSLTSTLEFTMPIATTPLYLYIYSHTLKLYPSPVWFLSAFMPLFMIILVIIITKRLRRLKDTQYTPFVEAEN